MSLQVGATAVVTLIDRTAPTVTPITIAGDATGSLGTGSEYFVDLDLISSGIKRSRHAVLKLRSIDGIFITSDPILIDSETKSKYWIDIQLVQKDSGGSDVLGELFRFRIGTPLTENTDKGLFLTIPLIAIEDRLKESLDSEQLILQTPKDAFVTRILNYFDHQGPDAPLIVINNLADIELPDNDILKQNWISQGPVTTHNWLVQEIERLAVPGVAGGSFQDFYYFFEPDPNATKTVFVKAEEFGARSSGVILDVLGVTGTTDENKQTFQTDNNKFKNVVIVRGGNSAHRLPMEHTRFASDVEHAKVSDAYSAIITYNIGEYVQFDVGGGNIQLFKSLVDNNLNNTPDTSPTDWNNLSTSIEFSPWTNDADVWTTNSAGHESPPAGFVGFAVDMNITRANYDRTDDYNEFEEISFKWVTKIGVNDPSTEPAAEIFDGQRYIVGSAPAGDFAGQANKLAQFDTSVSPAVWRFSNDPIFIAGSPPTQDSVSDLQTGQVYKWSGAAWVVAWTVSTDFGISSPFHPIKTITNVQGPTGVFSAVQFEYEWNTSIATGNPIHAASRGAWWHLYFPFPRQANTSPTIPVGDLYKQPILDFVNLDVTTQGLTGWNEGLDTEDLGDLRGVNVKVRLSLRNGANQLIDGQYDLPLIWWFLDKFDRIVYTDAKLRRNGEWDTVTFPAGPEAEMELYDNRIDELLQLFGFTLSFDDFLQEKEYTGVRFDWRQVKAMGCFYKDAYNETFFYQNAQNSFSDRLTQRLQQTGFDILELVTGSPDIGNAVIDNSKLSLDELTFIKDAYVSSRDVTNDDSRQKITSISAQADYINMKALAQGIEVRDAFFPQFQTLDAYGDVRMQLGLTFVAQGTRVPNSPLTMVCAEVKHTITQNGGYKMQVIGANKFTTSS